jgi:hypothetical protein
MTEPISESDDELSVPVVCHMAFTQAIALALVSPPCVPGLPLPSGSPAEIESLFGCSYQKPPAIDRN